MAPRSRFVFPHTDTLTLPGGDTVTVRRRLNLGEQRECFRACHDVVDDETDDGIKTGNTKLLYDPTKYGQMKVAAYLLDWSIADAPPVRGLDLRGRFAALNDIDPADFFEIRDAIDTHEAAQIAARLEEKKEAPTTNADRTSRLQYASAGASTGSES